MMLYNLWELSMYNNDVVAGQFNNELGSSRQLSDMLISHIAYSQCRVTLIYHHASVVGNPVIWCFAYF